MSVTEVNHPATPLAPVDEAVVVPQSVKDAAARAEAIHKQAYATPEPQPEPQPPAGDPEAVARQVEIEAAHEAASAAEQQPEPPPIVPTKEDLRGDDWAGRYNAMRGRYEKAEERANRLQDQLGQMAHELTQVQLMVRQMQQPQLQPQNIPTPPKKLVTDEDVNNYGTELIDLARRVATEAVSPELEALKQDNARLKSHVAQTTKQAVFQVLDQQVPNWREINRSADFKAWLNIRDIKANALRRALLNDAERAADAPRVVAFFRDFLSDTTGHVSAPQPEPVPQPPRQAATTLEALAAPGRARPASGEPISPALAAQQQTFSRAEVSKFYADKRKGAYAGREAEAERYEQALITAGRDGRIR
jgi:hypothetical protein